MTHTPTVAIRDPRDIDPTLDLEQEICLLKEQMNAVILAHYYQEPELQDIADFVGDSLELSRKAATTNADVIIFCGVRFMADVAKILNPNKTVLLPDVDAGCSLEDSCQPAAFKHFVEKHPNHTVLTYINSSAEVKALCDTCVTSSNVYKIMERIDNSKIYFLPDRLMGENVKKYLEDQDLEKELELYDGTCYVHEKYQPESVDQVRKSFPGVEILVHPECSSEVVDKADYVGSTSGMLDHVRQSSHESFFLLTECGLTGILESEFPDKHFVGTCTTCRYMKSNSLEDILNVLENPTPSNIVKIDPEVQKNALRCVDKMFSYLEN